MGAPQEHPLLRVSAPLLAPLPPSREQLTAGQTAPAVAKIVHLSPQAVRRIAHRYQQGGWEQALYERGGRGSKELLDASEKQRVIAMVCSDPPAGRARWTLRLIAEEAVKRKLVPQVGRETIRVLLSSHDLKPWREKMWCIPQLDAECVRKMEDVLAVYEKPYNQAEPVVCLDEKPVSLHAEIRPSRPARPGSLAKRDSEYERCGTANVFCAVEAKVGRSFHGRDARPIRF